MESQFSEQSFELDLLFEESKNAIEAFSQLSNFYEALHHLDKSILNSFPEKLISEYALTDIDFGSIKTRLVQILKRIPDEVLGELDWKSALGYLLVKAKYWAIKKLEEPIDSKEQVLEVTTKINKELDKLGTKHGIIINHINVYAILNSLDEVAIEANKLKEKESIVYKSKDGTGRLKRGIFINKPKVLSELGQTTITNETTEILKVKKVDMLSNDARWDFLNQNKRLPARILDTEWLRDFHERKVVLKPEDSLMVTLRTTHTYTPNFEDRKTDYVVVKVLNVISPDEDNSLQFAFSA